MRSWIRNIGLVLIAATGMFVSTASFAVDCPAGLVSGMPIDIEFGVGSQDATRCLEDTKDVKVVYQINQKCKSGKCNKPYAVGNILNAVKDYEITHGMKKSDYEIVAIVHSAAWPLILNNDATEKHVTDNPFPGQIEELLAKGVKVYFCQNTARSKKVKFENMIPGVGFVTAGVTAIADLQLEEYAYVQP